MKNFRAIDWGAYIPEPVCEQFSQYNELYEKAWELARAHVKEIPGMPQTPYMDEAFCETQVWIWDTCFMSFFCKFAQEVFPGIETFNNFYEPIHNGNSLPAIIAKANEPKWTGAFANQPFSIKVHIADNPPLFAWAEYENALYHGDKEYLKDLLENRQVLQKHYEWFESLEESICIPNVHCPTCLQKTEEGYKWEGGRSGMDNTPRGRLGEITIEDRPNNPDMLWIDAICQQALSAKCIADMYEVLGEKAKAKEWQEKFIEKKEIVNRLYWDEQDKFYYDIDCNDHHFYKVKTIASYWTLTAGIATEEQAEYLMKMVSDPETFGGAVPLVSLARNDADYSPKGKYWRGSLWLPTAYAAIKGLANYGFYEQAHIAACKIVKHMFATYKNYEPHTIWEAYAPELSTPARQIDDQEVVRPDFCGWSALGPISIYLEYVLGFHTINAFENVVEWAKPNDITGKIGVKNLRFGKVVTDIVADGNTCKVISNQPYTLKINGKEFSIQAGENSCEL